MRIEGLKFPYELKLYSTDDPDFVEHWRITYPYDATMDEIIVASAFSYVCLIRKGTSPIFTGEVLNYQFEFPLSYLKWFIGVLSRFQLKPNQGGYPPGTFADDLQMDEENMLFVKRGQNFDLGGIFGYHLENRRRHSYIDKDIRQRFFISDEYLFELGMMDALIQIEQDYSDGKL